MTETVEDPAANNIEQDLQHVIRDLTETNAMVREQVMDALVTQEQVLHHVNHVENSHCRHVPQMPQQQNLVKVGL